MHIFRMLIKYTHLFIPFGIASVWTWKCSNMFTVYLGVYKCLPQSHKHSNYSQLELSLLYWESLFPCWDPSALFLSLSLSQWCSPHSLSKFRSVQASKTLLEWWNYYQPHDFIWHAHLDNLFLFSLLIFLSFTVHSFAPVITFSNSHFWSALKNDNCLQVSILMYCKWLT